MKKLIITMSLILGCTPVVAENIYINGDVASRCSIVQDTAGSWGNPSANVLTTLPASGGQVPIIRFDYSLANAFYANISTPISFSTSPSLSDSTVFTGVIAVTQSSSSDMSGYQAASTTPTANSRQYALTHAGTTWFSATSVATHGGGNLTPFPSASYTGIVVASCIAQ